LRASVSTDFWGYTVPATRCGVRPKTESSTRTIPVADVVVDAIKQHFKDFGPHESGMFTTDLGAFVDTSTIHGA